MPADWPCTSLLAHRGGGTLAPENTMAALRAGYEAGYRGVEFDVMLAADGVPVLMHDEQRGRTLAGDGAVAALTSDQLARMDAGRWFGPAFAGEPVPLYREAFDYCQARGISMNVEIKPTTGMEAVTGAVVARLSAQWLGRDARAPLVFSSFSPAALHAARQAAPDIGRGLLLTTLPTDWRERLAALDAISLHLQHLAVSRDACLAVQRAGYALFCWTVNEPARVRELFQWGVDAVCTDRIDLVDPTPSPPPPAS